MIYVGIDNGLTGGIVFLGHEPGQIYKAVPMPTRGKSKGNEVDGWAVHEVLNTYHPEDITILLETPGKFAKGVMAISSMWDSYGTVRGVIEVMGIRHIRITPQSWQKVMLVGCKKGDTKKCAKQKCRQLWPEQDWKRTDRCTKDHDGMMDAALIAEYGRITQL